MRVASAAIYVARNPERVYGIHLAMSAVNSIVCMGNTFMLSRGNQLKAARALIGMEQEALADAAGVHVNTIRKMEAKGTAEITSGADTVRRVQSALEAAGVEFLDHGRPGVRLKPPAEPNFGSGLT